ncbi:MAG: HAMP domain-containing sensor histidine kinase [Bacteroidota bacterium]
MSISGGIRHRLVTVILLGVVTSALSLVALVRVISLSTSQRVERGRQGVQTEVARLANPGATDDARSPRSGLIGMQGGVVGGEQGVSSSSLPRDWHAPLVRVLAAARGARERVTTETTLPAGILVVSAQPRPSGETAWVAYLVAPPVWLRTWQVIVVALTLATALLVQGAIAAVITVKRGATALNAALDGLATDLSTPVPRPRLRELSDVADGIARLARRLVRSREIQEGMAHELAMNDRLAALGRVVAGVAHEVRNPLASIKLRLDLAAGGASPLPADVEAAIAHASREIARLDRLVADLLVVASPGVGPRQPIAVGSLVRARVDSLAPWCAIRGVAIDVRGDASASVDVDALARAVDNLLRNAVEASPADGRVEVSLREADDVVVIAVEDRGAGVPPQRAHELFEPFFTTKPDGTGLGLAICRAIARAHGGDVSFAHRDGATHVELTMSRSPEVGRGEASP